MKPGDIFERYRIIREIGAGSMATVYLAERMDRGQQVALKIVLGGQDGSQRERVEVELHGAKLQQELTGKDPRVVPVRNIVGVGYDLGIEMEFVDGQDLQKILRTQRSFEPARAARIALSICEMLRNLSTSTILIHGDLKPSNILLARNDEVRVVDFGIAKELAKTRSIGTFNAYQSLAYSSPERINTGRVDEHSDLWAIGVILYEMVAGRRPFPATDEDLRMRLTSPPDPLPASCPPALRNISLKMLARSVTSRYRSAADCAADLERFRSGQPVLATGTHEETRRTVPQPDTDATRRTAPQPLPRPPANPRRIRPRQWMRAGVWGFIVGTLLLFLIFVTRQYGVWQDAGELERKIQSHQVRAVDAFPQFQAIQARAKIPLLTFSLQRSLKARLVESADDVIMDYRRDQPTVGANDWNAALQNLQEALELGRQDRRVMGRLELCEGHLLRINARGATRVKSYNSAIAKFENASKLMPDSYDPYIGMARVYCYVFRDYDKCVEMVNQESKHGHSMGKRETAELADALRDRGVQSQNEAAQLSEMPNQEKQYLGKARDDFRSAAQYYSQLGTYSNAAAQCKDVLRRLQDIENRQTQIDAGQPTER